MGVEEGDRRGGLVGRLQLLDPGLEASNVLAHELGSGLALAIVVFASFPLLGFEALLTGGLSTVTFLHAQKSANTWRVTRGRDIPFSSSCT